MVTHVKAGSEDTQHLQHLPVIPSMNIETTSSHQPELHRPSHREKAKSRWARFNAPQQVKDKHKKWLRIFGPVGWVAKGVVYGIIGGITCDSALDDTRDGDGSPQGAFILVGRISAGVGLLILMAVGLVFYIIWRFWEAVTGQGTDQCYSKANNFFKFRLSPFVSGTVYTAYLAYVLYLVFTPSARKSGSTSSSLTNEWNDTGIGRFGLSMLGIAFTIATITQLVQVFTNNFHKEFWDDLNRWFWWFMVVIGHIGFLGRAGVFLFAAVLFYRSIGEDVESEHSTIGNSLDQLQGSRAGKACLFILGFVLLVYALFAVLCAYAREFPTRIHSGIKRQQTLPRPASESAAGNGAAERDMESGLH